MADLPHNLPDILRKYGLRVVELPGWRDRGRPGAFHPVGVLCHHTASSADGLAGTRILVNGRSDLPGPLSQLGLARDGTVYIVAAGRANHAGTAKPSGTMAGGNGNALYIGIEAMNRGTGEPWNRVQYDAYVLLCAVLSVEVTGNSAQTVRAHRETSVTAKIDPFGPTPYERSFDMDKFRSRVAAKMAEITRQPAPPKKEEPMPERLWHPDKSDPNYHMTQGDYLEELKDQLQRDLHNARQAGNKPQQEKIKGLLQHIRDEYPWWRQQL